MIILLVSVALLIAGFIIGWKFAVHCMLRAFAQEEGKTWIRLQETGDDNA